MQIWIYLNGIQQGPYTLEQLQTMGLDPNTPVWYEGLAQWTPASRAQATMPLFGQPAAGQNAEYFASAGEERPPKPRTYLVWNIILTVLCCNILALAGIITGSISSSKYSAGDYEGAKRMSNVTEWLLILAIVWMFIAAPVSIICNLL